MRLRIYGVAFLFPRPFCGFLRSVYPREFPRWLRFFCPLILKLCFACYLPLNLNFRIRVTRDKKERNDPFLGDFESFFYIPPGLYEFL
ncbi:hypothetical protein LBBP_03338 [Leptospira borgpetersenii serovar Ballum]|uniref:Uncharacterized protein n=1 Tax=Leptospira borgpetersenii serovar Ballum TaxID=280505 RepID=A0A0S2IV39_LEPBO|nr:hypothetical protein LBBP_03338 [Leptospira borgpetersenii serovar Ballum]